MSNKVTTQEHTFEEFQQIELEIIDVLRKHNCSKLGNVYFLCNMLLGFPERIDPPILYKGNPCKILYRRNVYEDFDAIPEDKKETAEHEFDSMYFGLLGSKYFFKDEENPYAHLQKLLNEDISLQ